MNNAWLVRPYPNSILRINEFRQDGIIAIGWPKTGDLTGKSYEEIKQILSGKAYQYTGLTLGSAGATINLFVNRMKVGDLVLVPNDADIFFAEIQSDYYMVSRPKGSQADYPHQRKVKWMQNVSRSDLSKALRSSLKVQRTTADLTKHYDEIFALAHGNGFQPQAATATIPISYPLRRDFTIQFELPADITKDEANRLAQYFGTLYYTE